MGTIYKSGKFTIRVNGYEHPPVHAHVTHTGVPDAVMVQAQSWINAHQQMVIDEWNTCNPKA